MYDLNLILPNVESSKYTADEKFKLLKSYLYELTQTLYSVLSSFDESTYGQAVSLNKQDDKIGSKSSNNILKKELKEEIADKFAELKSDILRTATDIEEAYSTAISESETEILESASHTFVTQSQFGTYRDSADTVMSQTSDAISLINSDIEEIETNLNAYKVSNNAELTILENSINSSVEEKYLKKDELSQTEEAFSSKITETAADITENFLRKITEFEDDLSSVGGSVSNLISSLDVYIRRGEIDDGVYGIEIGRSDSNIKARFTNDRLSFTDGNSEIAYISGNNLYITRAQVLDYLQIGNESQGYFTFDVTENGLEVRWSYGN